jgi:hypothetical protein
MSDLFWLTIAVCIARSLGALYFHAPLDTTVFTLGSQSSPQTPDLISGINGSVTGGLFIAGAVGNAWSPSNAGDRIGFASRLFKTTMTLTLLIALPSNVATSAFGEQRVLSKCDFFNPLCDFRLSVVGDSSIPSLKLECTSAPQASGVNQTVLVPWSTFSVVDYQQWVISVDNTSVLVFVDGVQVLNASLPSPLRLLSSATVGLANTDADVLGENRTNTMVFDEFYAYDTAFASSDVITLQTIAPATVPATPPPVETFSPTPLLPRASSTTSSSAAQTFRTSTVLPATAHAIAFTSVIASSITFDVLVAGGAVVVLIICVIIVSVVVWRSKARKRRSGAGGGGDAKEITVVNPIATGAQARYVALPP